MTLEELPILIAWNHPVFGPSCVTVHEKLGSLTTSLDAALLSQFGAIPHPMGIEEGSRWLGRLFEVNLKDAMHLEAIRGG